MAPASGKGLDQLPQTVERSCLGHSGHRVATGVKRSSLGPTAWGAQLASFVSQVFQHTCDPPLAQGLLMGPSGKSQRNDTSGRRRHETGNRSLVHAAARMW